MAEHERSRARTTEQFHLSDEDVCTMWDAIVTNTRRPKLERAMSAWEKMGEDYAGLPYQVAT